MYRCKYQVEEHKILTRKEECELFKLYEIDRKISIRNYIVMHNMKFAMASANCFVRKYFYIDPHDLKQYAMMALFTAVDKFDWRLGKRFVTMAAYEIKNNINRHAECLESTVRYSADLHRKMQTASKLDGIDPTMEIAYHNILGGTSLDKKTESGFSLSECIADKSESDILSKIEDDNMVEILRHIIDTELSQREKLILNVAFGFDGGEPGRLKDLAPILKCSPDYVRYLKSKVIKKLKDATRYIAEELK
jgi:RNA polymerase sigma factor (sigma-70 family)